MNYIKRLEKELAQAREQIAMVEGSIKEITSYLESPKFREDTTVQAGDILLRLNELSLELQHNRISN